MSTPERTRSADSTVSIGTHQVGTGERVFVIAEAGVNHDGQVERAFRLVDIAADAGADAVKFQLFNAADLVESSAPLADYQRKSCRHTSQLAMLASLELGADAMGRIREHCDRRGIMFLATPFGPKQVDDLVNLGVEAIKIASTDLTDTLLLDRAIATGLPLILSTGASTATEIGTTVSSLERVGAGGRLILMHCVSCYPTPLDSINLRAIASLTRDTGLLCGLSDHTTSTDTGAWAVAAGACLLEKHFTFDREATGPDHAMSLAPDELSAYVTGVRAVERALGDGTIGLAECAKEVRQVASKSVFTTVDIPSGTSLTSEMLTLKRPGVGLAPDSLQDIVRRKTSVEINANTMLTWDMLT